MIDSMIGGLLSLGVALLAVAWLAQRQYQLEQRVQDMGGKDAAPSPDLQGYDEMVVEMVEQLKAAADIACREVAEKIDALRQVESAAGRLAVPIDAGAPEGIVVGSQAADASPAAQPAGGTRRGLPLERIVELAEQGLSTIDIARQTGTGPAEVELALQYHRGKTPFFTALRRMEAARRTASKEVAVA